MFFNLICSPFSYSKLEKLDEKNAELEDLLQREQSRTLGNTYMRFFDMIRYAAVLSPFVRIIRCRLIFL